MHHANSAVKIILKKNKKERKKENLISTLSHGTLKGNQQRKGVSQCN